MLANSGWRRGPQHISRQYPARKGLLAWQLCILGRALHHTKLESLARTLARTLAHHTLQPTILVVQFILARQQHFYGLSQVIVKPQRAPLRFQRHGFSQRGLECIPASLLGDFPTMSPVNIWFAKETDF